MVETGCVTIVGAVAAAVTIRTAGALVSVPTLVLTMTRSRLPLSSTRSGRPVNAGRGARIEYVAAPAPATLAHAAPSALDCHWYVRASPVATTLKVAGEPATTVVELG